MPILSSNPMWEAFGLRALAYTAYGGADIGECFSTIAKVGHGTTEDWYRQWSGTAERVFAIGVTSEAAGHFASAREAHFRASTYFHVSYLPLFGASVDPWLVDAFARETDAFRRAARLSDSRSRWWKFPSRKCLCRDTSCVHRRIRGRDPTVLHVNGYDSNIQEMYFAHGPAAVRRGYNALLLDGPGQGRNLIRDGVNLRPDWENVVRAAIDYLFTRPEVDPKRIVLAGWSFGGLLAARAAAFEKRIAALIADPGLWDQRPDLSAFHLPPEVILNFPDIDPHVFDAVEEQFRSPAADPMASWKILQRGLWVHGVDSLYDLVCELCRFEISSIAHQISCPTLITAPEGDPLARQAVTLYEALTCPKRLVSFTAAEGAGGHCESLARSLYHQRVFDWLDSTLAVECPAQ